MKKLFITLMATLAIFTLVGCSKTESNAGSTGKLPEDLNEVMDGVYAGFKQDELPMLQRTPLDAENVSYFLGIEEMNFEEGLASEALIGSIAHSVILVKTKDASEIEALKAEIEAKINPRKWVCVGVEEVKYASRDNVLLVVLEDTIGDTLVKNFLGM